MTLPDWSDPFAPLCFHKASSLLRTCPPLTNAHRLLLALQFVLLVPLNPLLFRTPWRTYRRFYLFNWLGFCQVLLFHCLACVSVLPSLYRTSCSQEQFITAALYNNMRRNVAFDVNLKVFDTSSKVHLRSTHLHAPNR